jgi:hypothetical protein
MECSGGLNTTHVLKLTETTDYEKSNAIMDGGIGERISCIHSKCTHNLIVLSVYPPWCYTKKWQCSTLNIDLRFGLYPILSIDWRLFSGVSLAIPLK